MVWARVVGVDSPYGCQNMGRTEARPGGCPVWVLGQISGERPAQFPKDIVGGVAGCFVVPPASGEVKLEVQVVRNVRINVGPQVVLLVAQNILGVVGSLVQEAR